MDGIIIETERLILREFRLKDVEAVYEFSSNTEVQRYIGDELITSLHRAKEIITDVWFNDYKKYGYGRWAIIYKPDNKIIGFAGLKYLPELKETDIGYRFLPKYWGKGIATEAAKEIIKYGFEVFALDKIIGIADPENISSCKVLEKIGLTFYEYKTYDGSTKKYNWYKLEKGQYFQYE